MSGHLFKSVFVPFQNCSYPIPRANCLFEEGSRRSGVQRNLRAVSHGYSVPQSNQRQKRPLRDLQRCFRDDSRRDLHQEGFLPSERFKRENSDG